MYNLSPLMRKNDAGRCVQLIRYFRNSSVYLKEPDKYFEEKPNILETFAGKTTTFSELHKYNPKTFTIERFRKWKQKIIKDMDCFDQKFVQLRHDVLGNDLATCHFLVSRGGKVKFIGSDVWITKDTLNSVPNKYTEGYYLEAIDASGLRLIYEGLSNLVGLYHLKTLILSGCPNIDDWCIDRISGEFQDTLEHLDLTDCHSLTENCLSCFYRFSNLKSLNLENVALSPKFHLTCLLLEDANPQLTIKGVKYLTC